MDNTEVKKQVIESFFQTLSYKKKNLADDLLTGTPFDQNEKVDQTFLQALQENLTYQYEQSDFFKKFCEQKHFVPQDLQTIDDIKNIPFLITDVFKSYTLKTTTSDPITIEITSSGTSGKKSHITLDTISGVRLLYSTYHIYKAMGLMSTEKVNYLMATYNPEVERTVATANSDLIVSHFAPSNRRFYALDLKDGEMTFLIDEAVEELREFAKETLPIRILGFPHHIVKIIEAYSEKYGRLVTSENSYILTGGGWKGFAKLYGDHFDSQDFLKKRTSFDYKNVRDVYSLVEHGIVYLECEYHHKHVPNESRVLIRDPKSLEVLGDNTGGLIQLITPLFESYPNISILTTDFGYIDRHCPCGREAPFITITGRASLSKSANCALTADQLLDKK